MPVLLILAGAAAVGYLAWRLFAAQRDARCIHAARRQARQVRRDAGTNIGRLVESSSLGMPEPIGRSSVRGTNVGDRRKLT